MEEKNNLKILAEISRYFGRNPDFVLAGGGNTSFKDENTLYVKASGHSLADITEDGFAALERKKLKCMLGKKYPSKPELREEYVKNDLLEARLFPEKGQRPSVESNFHELIEYPWVMHLHPCVVNALTCSKEGRKYAREIFGGKALWLEYTDPGYKLALAVRDALRKWSSDNSSHPEIILMQNHGIIAAGNSPEAVKKTLLEAVSLIDGRIEDDIPEHISSRNREITPLMREVSLFIRGAFGDRRKIIFPADMLGIEAVQEEDTGPITPDQIVYCRPETVRIDDDALTRESISSAVKDYIKRKGYEPSLFIVEGAGIFGAGDDYSAAKNSAYAFWDAARTALAARSFGGARFLSGEETGFIDSWEVENYRRKAASGGEKELGGLIAVVTGGAQGVGKGVAGALAEKGAHVVIADMNAEKAKETADAIIKKHGENKALPLEADISDEKTVERMFDSVIDAYGGIDLLINNAGILLSGNILDLKYEDFKKVIDINLNASYLCAQKAAKAMVLQGRGDIIQMSSKSGKAGSRNNSAYASSKFAAVGLAQSLAMDLIPHNIYVNALCPGNFLDLDLWQSPGGLFDQYLKAGKVPGAKTRHDVEEHYKKQTLLGRGCKISDLINAVLYILKQRGETGQAYNITQGQTMH